MESKNKKKSPALRFFRALTALLFLSCAVLAGYVFLLGPAPIHASAAPQVEEDALFSPGVSIMGVSLGGMDMARAFEALLDAERQLALEMQFVLRAKHTAITLTHTDLGVHFDTAELLKRAIAYGNTGTKAEREAERKSILESPLDLPLSYTLDLENAHAKLAQLEQAVFTPPTNASVVMDMNVRGFFKYTEGMPGETLDTETLMSLLQQRAQEKQFGEIELPILFSEPEVSADMLRTSLTLRAVAETSFKKSPYNREDRVFNVKRAASLVNGFVLKPDEVFSMNDTLGPRTYELGWKPAPAIVSGTTEDQAGGGVCQVSSTLYAAVVKSDLEIVFRRNHSSPVGYMARGLDATINTGTIDFQFKNNTQSDIYIFAYAIDAKDGKVPEGKDDKTLHIEIYGEPFPDTFDEIRLTAEKTETLSPKGEMEVIVDRTVAPDYYNKQVERKDGSVYQSYKHYYKDGKEIKKEPLAKSTYKAYAGKLIVGTGYYGETPAVLP